MAVPTITSLTPDTGPTSGGTSVAVVGTGFTGTTDVTVGGTAATSFSVVDDSNLTVVVEAHAAGSDDLVVTNADGPSVPDVNSTFVFVAAPTIASLTPDAGPVAGGTTLHLVGTGFTGTSAVSVGGSAATSFSVVNDTHLTVVTEAHAAGAASVVVTATGGDSTAASFRYAAIPAVTSLTPGTDEEAGGNVIHLVGSGFTEASAVKFGTTSAAFTVVDDTHITATDPGHAVGLVDVEVTTPGGTSAAVTGDHFTFTAPVEGSYVQPDGDDEGLTYFMDAEMTPAALADGSLHARLDTHVYPQLGKIEPPKQGDDAFPPATPAAAV